jgi:histidyl-tRNA synthetase
MRSFQPRRGMRDSFASDERARLCIVEQCQTWSMRYGFEPIQTPLLEASELFHRSVGEQTDIVGKEMYEFDDRDGERVCLRPNGTAAVMRAFLNAGLAQSLPQKWFYSGAMFRYERPQKGRYRLFDQFGVEYIGDSTSAADVEVIQLGSQILQALSIEATLEINTLGDSESYQAYRDALHKYLQQQHANLSHESQLRMDRNPLRVLDSKDPQDHAALQNAPVIVEFLNKTSRDFYQQVKTLLAALEIPFVENPKLVRGLDYYSHTAFEFKSSTLGTQSTVLAGGRYDGLCRQLGGSSLPAVGWACGVDRLMLLVSTPPQPNRIAWIPVGDPWVGMLMKLANRFRARGYCCDLFAQDILKKSFKMANRRGCQWAVVMGEQEFQTQSVRVKHLQQMESENEQLVPLNDLESFFMTHIRHSSQ